MQLAVPHTADQRSAEILGLVRQAFVEKGFDGASMQDLARAAGMSVGNFYRYFPSKAAIIQALIDADHAELRRDFAIIRQSPHPMAALRQMVRSELASECMGHDTTLWTEIDAASQRNPDIGAAVQRMEAEVASCLIGIFAVECGMPEDKAKAQFSAQAAFIMVLFKAASCLKSPVSSHHGELKSLIIRTIDQTLDDVAPSSLKA